MDPPGQCNFRTGVVQPKLGTIMRSLKHRKIFLQYEVKPTCRFTEEPQANSQTKQNVVIPVKTGIQKAANNLDSRFRGNDKKRG
jgi:hypothetical protein